mmetsp:Transcript_43070/g.48750  ORF Transcript_43070/g.48750 Transcript_43070/m.48750 type:complete len:713 (-) Transcript_43070:323-2461(-)
MSQRKQKHRGMNGEEDDDNRSMTSQRSSLSSLSQRSRSSMKKGMKSFGKGIKKVFQSPKKRRKKKKGGGGGEGDDDASCGSAASYGSSHSLPLSSSPRSPRRNEEWTSPESANGRGSGPVDVDTVEDNTNTTYDNNSNNSMGGQQRPSQSRPSRISLPKVVEGENEDYDSTSDHLGSIKNSSHHKKKRSPLTVFSNKKNKNRNSGSSAFSRGSKQSNTNRFSPSPIAPTPARKADELSLVILLVDPTSLRFELLSLDFDLATHQVTPTNQQQEEQKKNNKKNKSPRKSKNNENKNETTSSSVSFTVQDVLDQITPESLTEETIKHNLLFKTTPIGLIDRTDQIHFGSASLDAVCSSRPLRNIMDCDFQKRLQQADPNSTPGPISLSLCDLTYSGTPHRDVLLAYFGTKGDTAAEEDRVRATIALSRPIFTDPNVASLMEHNGYDVSGWNGKKVNSISSAAAFAAADTSVNESSPSASSSTTTDATTTPTSAASASSRSAAATTTPTPITTLLGKPLPAKKRPKSSFCTRLVNLLLVLLTVLAASLMAWSIVSGSLYVLPSVFGSTRNSNSSHPLVTTSTSSTPIRNTSTSTSTSTKAASSYDSRATTITTSATDTDTEKYYSQNLPHTMEGYLRLGYASISSWMRQKLSQQERKEDTDTTSDNDDVVVNNDPEEEGEKDDATTTIDVDDDKENENDRRDRMDGSDEIIDLDL